MDFTYTKIRLLLLTNCYLKKKTLTLVKKRAYSAGGSGSAAKVSICERV